VFISSSAHFIFRGALTESIFPLRKKSNDIFLYLLLGMPYTAVKKTFQKSDRCRQFLGLLYSFLCFAFTAIAQNPAKGPEAKSFNFTTPTEIKRIKLPEGLYDENSAWRKHPEFSTLPYNSPCEDCHELIERRTESTRYFVQNGSEGKTFFEQTAYGPLHIKNAEGFWVSIDARLVYEPGARLSARNQTHPFTISLQNATCTSENLQHRFSWNKNLELLRTIGSQTNSLGQADLSKPQYGENGVIFKDAWPGVDIVIYSLLSAVHTDFKFKTDPGAGSYTIVDHLEYSADLKLNIPNGKFSDAFELLGTDNKSYFTYERAFVFDSVNNKSNILYLDYEWNTPENALAIHFNRDLAVQTGLSFPMTIDPLVTSTNTLPVASITGSGYNAVCFTGGCSFNLTVPSPANAQITDVLFSFDYLAQNGCWRNEGATSFSFNGCNSPNLPGYFWFCNLASAGPCTGSNLSIFSDIQPCIPPPICGSNPMNFTLKFYRCFQAGGGCSNNCIGALSPWLITVRGQTVFLSSAFASNANICAGASTNLNANFTFGVPPHTVTWNPGGLNGSPVSVSPSVSTLYTATVSDACGITSTQNVNVTVTPATNPGFTIIPNPVCVGEPVTISGLGAGAATSYDWLLPGSSSPAINNQQVLNGITYATSGTNDITLNYTQGACVFPQTLSLNIDPTPTLPIIAYNGPVCEGDQILLDAPNIAGATYSWTGPGGFTSALEDPIINNATIGNSGIYQLIVTVNGCASPAASLNVVVNPTPSLPVIGSNTPICEGQSINLNSNNVPGAVYNWSGPNGFNSALEDPVITNATVGMSGTYNLSISIGTCQSPSANLNISVNPLPVVNTGNTGPYCTAGTIQLNASGGTNYSWSGPGAFNSNLQNPVIPNCTVANSGIYTVVITDANGCTANATTNVVVNNTLAIVAGSNSPICEGEILNLNSPAVAGGIYTWSGPGGFNSNLQNPAVNNVSNLNSGSYTVDIIDANGCTGSAAVNVTVNALPIAIAANSSPVCEGDNVTLNASGGTLYSWSGPAGFLSNNQNPTLAGVNAAMSGSYSVIVTDGNNCSASASTNVTVNPIPVGIASNTGAYCEGGSISLSVNAGSAFIWSGPAGFNSNQQNPLINNSTVGMAGIYSVTVSDANNCSATFTTNVLVNPLPNANALNNGPICEGDNLVLNASGGISYSWSGVNAFNSILQNTGIANCSIADAGAYTVTVTDANNCSASAVTNVVINAAPVSIAGNTGPYCVNGTVLLNASGGNSYSWSGPAGFSSNVQNPSIPNAGLTAGGNYTVLVSGANGCTSVSTTNVQISPNLTVNASYAGSLCEGTPFSLDVTPTPGASYQWSGPNGFNSNIQSPNINNAQMNMSGSYSVLVTSASGCSGTSVVNINVLQAPLLTAGNNGPLCTGDNALLNANGNGTFFWTGPNGFTSNQQNPAINSANSSASGLYQVTLTGANTCTALAGTQLVINPAPVFNIIGSDTLCEGSSLNLSVNAGSTCIWTSPAGNTQNSLTLLVNQVTQADAGTFSAVVSDAIGCTATQNFNLTVLNRPDASFSTSAPTGCAPLCIDFTALDPTNIATYEWRRDGQTVSSQTNPSICFPVSGLYDIALTATAPNGCISTYELDDYIRLEQLPVADFITDKSEAYVTEPIIRFTNTSIGGSIFNWDFADGSTGQGEDVEHRFPLEGEYCVILTALTNAGCGDSKEICIKINPDFFIFIPTAFSPNGDGLNDKFEIKGSGIDDFELEIFDRWGGRIVVSTQEDQGWDGSVAGRLLPQGVYIYHLKIRSLTGLVKEFTGDFTITR
jgi:gliding motility-associated-like protein